MVMQTHSAYYFSITKISNNVLNGNILISFYIRSHLTSFLQHLNKQYLCL